MEKMNLVVLFGGQSSEHEVSCMSVVNVLNHIDTEKYNIYRVGITMEGRWLYVPETSMIPEGTWRDSKAEVIFSPDASKQSIYIREDGSEQQVKVDVAFPVLHGLNGEDGTIQGLFELAKIPYVGCGVLASAVSMDKFYTKICAAQTGVKQAAYVTVLAPELSDMEKVVAKIENALPYPVFVKPSRAGSSKGVNKANNKEELINALAIAAENDSKILIEETIVGREVECAVLCGKASGVGEVLAAADAAFYDFEAKYFNADSKTTVTPLLPEGAEEEIRHYAEAIFASVDGCGLSRVDFFLRGNEIIFNEINTLPGFTAISMYPMLWAHKGIEKDELVERLIQSAFTR